MVSTIMMMIMMAEIPAGCQGQYHLHEFTQDL